MIPTAILGGFVLGAFIRWWAIPVVGLLWAIAILFIEPSAVFVGFVLGAINAAVGALPAVGIRQRDRLTEQVKPADPTPFARRFKALVELLKSGDREDVESVVVTLRERELEVGLSGGEQRMLAKAEQLLGPPPAANS